MKELDQFFEIAVNGTRKKRAKFNLIVGTVTDIEGDTCTVGDYEDVRLNAVIDTLDSQFTIYPKIGSKVIIGSLENQSDMFIVKVSEVEKVVIKIGGQLFEFKENNVKIIVGNQLFEMTQGKFTISSGSVSLKAILNDAFDQLDKAIITTPSGPGKFSPADKLVFKNLKTKTNQLLS